VADLVFGTLELAAVVVAVVVTMITPLAPLDKTVQVAVAEPVDTAMGKPGLVVVAHTLAAKVAVNTIQVAVVVLELQVPHLPYNQLVEPVCLATF
jgi:hypothetical protein